MPAVVRQQPEGVLCVFRPTRRRNLVAALSLCHTHPQAYTIGPMKISARNQLRGKVEAIVLGLVTAKVTVRVGENLIESVITRQSVEDLSIKVGDEVTAVIKSTEIMLMVD